MTTCPKCGNKIIFRYINDICTPLHINGECREETSSKSTITSKYLDSDFCKPTKCPKCNLNVFFIRHNGGTVWVDALGCPWPKHACFDNSKGYRNIHKLKSAIKNVRNSILGLIVRTKTSTNYNITSTIIATKCDDNKGRCFLLKGNHRELLGQIVTICLDKFNLIINIIKNDSIISYDILSEIEPDRIELNNEWLKNPNNIKAKKSNISEKLIKIQEKLNKLNVKFNGNETYDELNQIFHNTKILNKLNNLKLELTNLDINFYGNQTYEELKKLFNVEVARRTNSNKLKKIKQLQSKLNKLNINLTGNENYNELIQLDKKYESTPKVKKLKHIDLQKNDNKQSKNESNYDILLKIIQNKNIITPERKSKSYTLLKKLNYRDLQTVYETYYDNRKKPEVLLRLIMEEKIDELKANPSFTLDDLIH